MSTNEMKTINYNGMELLCIESGYWKDGVTLVGVDRDCSVFTTEVNVICLHNGVAFYADGESSEEWGCWAIFPPKPAARRLTNRELAGLARKCYDVLWNDCVVAFHDYAKGSENAPCSDSVQGVRAPNTDEWLEPTSDLLEK